jgi:hypothetical protein
MTLPSSPPITLQQIESEFGVSSLSAAGLAYFGRANCNMLEFLGASNNVYNFQNYQAYTYASGTYDLLSAYVTFSSGGTVSVYYDPVNNPAGLYNPAVYNWLVRGSSSGVEGYVTRQITPSPGMNEPTLNSWIPIGNIGFGASSYPPANEYGAWSVTFRNSQGTTIGSSSVSVTLYTELPERFGTSNYSDIRLKENIQKIGQIDGLNIYNFNYLNSSVKQTGVMAQELLGTKYESAVSTDANGFYKVDYSKIPDIKHLF